jgi:hypothetical protein
MMKGRGTSTAQHQLLQLMVLQAQKALGLLLLLLPAPTLPLSSPSAITARQHRGRTSKLGSKRFSSLL